MRRFQSSWAFLCALLLLCLSPSAWAQTTLFSDNFNRADGTSLGNGWVDPAGVATVSGNTAHINNSGGDPWFGEVISRTETARDVVVGFTRLSAGSSAAYLAARRQSNGQCYFAGIQADGGISYGTVRADGSLGLQNATGISNPNTANVIATFSVSGANPTTCRMTVTNATTNESNFFEWTDSTSGLQTAGKSGFFGYNGTNVLDDFSYTTTDAGATPPPPSPVVVPVTSSAFRFSPATWIGDTGRGGSAWRQSWNNGAWFSLTWSTTATSPTAVISATGGNTVRTLLSKNGGTETAGTSLNLSSQLSGAGTYKVRVFLRASSQNDRWATNASSTLRVTGATLDADATAGTAAALQPWVFIVGDSITEGIGTSGSEVDYSHLVGEYLRSYGYDYTVSACGYSGYLQTGDGYDTGDVPRYYYVTGSTSGAGGTYNDSGSRWNKIASGVSLLDSANHISAYGQTNQEPAAIYLNYGTNEDLSGVTSTSQGRSDLTASVRQAMQALRTAAPNAHLIIQIPFGQYAKTQVTAGYNGYVAANGSDTKVHLIDLGAIALSGIHPNDAEHAVLGGLLSPVMAGFLVSPNVSSIMVATGALVSGGTSPTYPSAANVRSGTDRGDGTPGTLVVPTANRVLTGTTFDATTAGTLTLPGASSVLIGVSYGIGGNGTSGTVTLPATSNVLSGITYGASLGLTGSATAGSGSGLTLSALQGELDTRGLTSAKVSSLPTAQQVATAVLAATIDGSLTMKQAMAIDAAISAGKANAPVINQVSHTQTTTYYRVDGTTPLVTFTVTYLSDNKTIVSRTITFSNLP